MIMPMALVVEIRCLGQLQVQAAVVVVNIKLLVLLVARVVAAVALVALVVLEMQPSKVLQVVLVALHNRLVAVEAVLVWQVLMEAMPELLVMVVTD